MSDQDKQDAAVVGMVHRFMLATWALIYRTIAGLGSLIKALLIGAGKAFGKLIVFTLMAIWAVLIMYISAMILQHGPQAALELIHYKFLLFTGQIK